MHRRCRHDSSEKSSTFARFANSTQTFLDSDRKGHEFCKDDSNIETQSQDEDSSEAGHGLTARYDFKIQHCSRSLLPGDVAPFESDVKYSWSGEDVTFDPGGHNLVRRERRQNGSQSEPQKFGSGENVTFDPGGQNPVDHTSFQHGSRLFQPSCVVSTTETLGSDANAWYKWVDRRSEKTSSSKKRNVVHSFQPRNPSRKERFRISDENLNIPATAAFEEPDITIREHENGVLDLCCFINSIVFFVFGNDCGTEHQFKELRFRRTKDPACWNGFDKSFWTNEFGLDCYDTRPINMGWDVAFIFETEESPFIYDVCVIELNALNGQKRKRKTCVKISCVFTLDYSFTQSIVLKRFCPLNLIRFDMKSLFSAKNHVETSSDVNIVVSFVCKNVLFDMVKFCKEICLYRSHFKSSCLSRSNLILTGSSEVFYDVGLPSHRIHADKTCLSFAGSVKQVIDWRKLLSDVVISGYRRICCISDSSRGKSIADCLRFDLRQYGCQVSNIDDMRCGMSELDSVEESLLSCDCVVVVLSRPDVSREVEFILNMVIASGQLSLYSVVTSFDIIEHIPCLLKPFPLVTIGTALALDRDKTLFCHKKSYRSLRFTLYDRIPFTFAKLLVSGIGCRIRVLMDEEDYDANMTLRCLRLHCSSCVVNDDDIAEGKPIFTELARELYADRVFVIIPPKSEPSFVYRYALKVLHNRIGFQIGEIPHCSALLLMF